MLKLPGVLVVTLLFVGVYLVLPSDAHAFGPSKPRRIIREIPRKPPPPPTPIPPAPVPPPSGYPAWMTPDQINHYNGLPPGPVSWLGGGVYYIRHPDGSTTPGGGSRDVIYYTVDVGDFVFFNLTPKNDSNSECQWTLQQPNNDYEFWQSDDAGGVFALSQLSNPFLFRARALSPGTATFKARVWEARSGRWIESNTYTINVRR